jgi:RimJ/RimL family protein N-acetyltransferase
MITLRNMTEQDIPLVIAFLGNTSEEFMSMWGGGRLYKHPVTEAQMRTQFHTRTVSTRYFIICDDGKPIGSVELDFIKWEEKECSVCRFLIAEANRGKGYGTEALETLTEYAFQELDMRTVKLTVFDFNTRALSCYLKAGFVEIGRKTRDNGWIGIEMEKRRSVD